ncbi:MAG: glycosyltransferase, partial [Owenweeksia sp.]
MEWVIYIGIFSSVFLVIYYLVVFGRLLLYRVPRGLTSFDKPVTILVCAHNEAENLRKNLPYLLTQYYENDFEVLVINDHSTDGTAEVLNELCLPYKKLRSIDFTEEKKFKGKKEALSFGLSHARYGHILLTDADCQPASKDWLNLMSGSFDTREVVLGYGGYLRESGFTNKLVRWETLQTAIQYMSLALIGRPYMG